MSDQMDSGSNIPGYPNNGSADASIDAPQLNQAGTALKLEKKAVKNVAQAFNICKTLEKNNERRALRTADMQALCDGKPPKSAASMRERGKSWTANFSSLWLAGIVGRVAQRLINAQISQVYVTASALPDNYTDAKTKSDSLRKGFTQLVRGWDGNTSFVNNVAMENTLQGYCYALFLDPYTWHPTFFKQEDCLVPEKSGQHARTLQLFCARRDFRVDEFIKLFEDEKSAEDVGYNLKNCLEAASKAVVQDQREDANTVKFRNFVDMIDEGAIGLAMGGGERVVKTWMLFYREYDGQVSFYLIERDKGTELRFSFKLFKRMQDLMAMFSFEVGNGCIHSSKGLGRKLAALAAVKELLRCDIVDALRMSSMMVVSADAKDKTKFAPVMLSPFIIVDKSVDLKGAQQFTINADGLKIGDTLIDSWAQQAVGIYLEAQLNDQGKVERTATEATIDEQRAREGSDIMIRRSLDQNANPIQMQQLRVCSKDNLRKARRIYEKSISDPSVDLEDLYPEDIDEAAVMRFLVAKMEEGITDDEFRVWSKSQASAFAHVTEVAVARGVSQAKAKYTGNQNIDQAELDYADLENMVGANMAKKLFIPKANETAAIESGRKQMIESFVMGAGGVPIEVSPRDNHVIEGAVVVEFLTNAVAPQLSKADSPPAILKTAELNLNHLGEHLKFGAQQGMNKLPAFQEIEKFYEGFKKQLSQVIQIREEARVAQEMVQAQVRTEPVEVAIPAASDVPGDFEPSADEAAPLVGVGA